MFSSFYSISHFLYNWQLEFYLCFGLSLLIFPIPFAVLQKKKLFFILLALLPLLGEGFYTGITYGAWRYRMQLYEQYGKHEKGWYDISLMPEDKKTEYAKYAYRPRWRNVAGGIVRMLVLVPVYYFCGSLLYIIIYFFKRIFLKKGCKKE